MKTRKKLIKLPTEQEINAEIERLRDNARYRNALAGTFRIVITAAAISGAHPKYCVNLRYGVE